MYRLLIGLMTLIAFAGCGEPPSRLVPGALKPTVVTAPTEHDTDDPAIWINRENPAKSLIVGTDKETGGGLYVFDLEGKIVNKFTGMKRPNNVDIAYGFLYKGEKIDIAVATEREANKIRVFTLPDLQPIDNGGLNVFDDSPQKSPMGIALYTRPADQAIFAIVGRKSGPPDNYLYQYLLTANNSVLQAELVRKFGKYSEKKEIEAIAVDNELGYVYYSDEQYGIHKYYADPAKQNNQELALFGQADFKEDLEGISIYKTSDSTGYLLVSNQQANTFNIYKREGAPGQPHVHQRFAEIPLSTLESDGSEVTNVNLGPQYPIGMLVAMSNGKVFHYYDWRVIAEMGGLP